jgi:hypothetical protein
METSAREAAETLRTMIKNRHPQSNWLVDVTDEPLGERTPPSSRLLVAVSQQDPEQDDLPGDWMGYHVKVVTK